jgi:hypothetical protein
MLALPGQIGQQSDMDAYPIEQTLANFWSLTAPPS